MPIAQARPVEYRHLVRFAADRSEPDPLEQTSLDGFLVQLPAETALHLRVVSYADDPRELERAGARARTIARLVHTRLKLEPGTDTVMLSARAGAPVWPAGGTVMVVATRYVALVPDCPDWSHATALDPQFLPLGRLGCINIGDLALMVADPADLDHGRALGAADGAREGGAITRYETDKVKTTQQETVTP